jgi:predicted RNase H-like nuclease (RuvC/YqgF family)
MNEEAVIGVLTRALEAAQDRIEELEREASETRDELRIYSIAGDHREVMVSRMIQILAILPNRQGFVIHGGDKIRVMKADTLETVKARMGWE